MLTRSIAASPAQAAGAVSGDPASASGFISENPRHWAIESFIPINPYDLVPCLARRGELRDDQVEPFRHVAKSIETALGDIAVSYDRRFRELYRGIDPDQDTRRPLGVEAGYDDSGDNDSGDDDNSNDKSSTGVENSGVENSGVTGQSSSGRVLETLELCREVLVQAGYREVSREEIEACVGVASQWGVPLHVEFGMFKQLIVYCRGDIIGSRVRRRLRKFYKIEAVDVAVYQRMVVMFQLQSDVGGDEELLARTLHLRLFKNIPKQDIDMLLPCTKVKFTWLDRLKIVVPSLGGLLMSARKIINTILILAVLTLKSTFVIVGLVLAAVGYIVRSVLGYFQTKNRYLLNLTRNLYFQKLDTNSGVGYQIIHHAHEQATSETVLAYYALISASESLSERKWRRRCERIIREAIDLEVDVNINRASERLAKLNLATFNSANDHWSPCDATSVRDASPL